MIAVLIGITAYVLLLSMKQLMLAAIVLSRLLWLLVRDGPYASLRMAIAIAIVGVAVVATKLAA